MNRQQPPIALALAACSFALPKPAGGNRITLQVTPAGEFRPNDGREMIVPAWYIDADIAAAVIQRFEARRRPPVLDYEHQTLLKAENGQPAPAAGWFRRLEWREGQGLFAEVELTARAQQYLDGGEYRYFSPVFLFDRTTGAVLDLQMGALTNDPAIDDMEPLAIRAAACFGLHLPLPENNPVDPLLAAVQAALGLADTTTEEQAIAALSAHTGNLRTLLGLNETAGGDTVLAACTGLKAKAASATAPDPARYVPVEALKGVQEQVAVLTARLQARDTRETEALIEGALADGRLLKPMESWARDLAKTDVAALTAYLDAAAPLAALAGPQTRGRAPAPDEKTGLTPDELAVCTAMGLTAEQFKSAKGVEQ